MLSLRAMFAISPCRATLPSMPDAAIDCRFITFFFFAFSLLRFAPRRVMPPLYAYHFAAIDFQPMRLFDTRRVCARYDGACARQALARYRRYAATCDVMSV